MAGPKMVPRTPDLSPVPEYDSLTVASAHPSHEKKPSRRDSVLAIYCTVKNYSKNSVALNNEHFLPCSSCGSENQAGRA